MPRAHGADSMAERSLRLQVYIAVERKMMRLDDAKDPLDDVLRDALDPISAALNKTERDELNARGMVESEAIIQDDEFDILIEEVLRTLNPRICGAR
jgi:hypothetical protein